LVPVFTVTGTDSVVRVVSGYSTMSWRTSAESVPLVVPTDETFTEIETGLFTKAIT